MDSVYGIAARGARASHAGIHADARESLVGCDGSPAAVDAGAWSATGLQGIVEGELVELRYGYFPTGHHDLFGSNESDVCERLGSGEPFVSPEWVSVVVAGDWGGSLRPGRYALVPWEHERTEEEATFALQRIPARGSSTEYESVGGTMTVVSIDANSVAAEYDVVLDDGTTLTGSILHLACDALPVEGCIEGLCTM